MLSKKKNNTLKLNQLQFELNQMKLKNNHLIQRNKALQQQLHKAIKIINKYQVSNSKGSTKSIPKSLQKCNNASPLLYCNQLIDDPYALRYLRSSRQPQKHNQPYYQRPEHQIQIKKTKKSIFCKSYQKIKNQNQLLSTSLNQISISIAKISQKLIDIEQKEKQVKKQAFEQPLLNKLNEILQKLNKLLNNNIMYKTDAQISKPKQTDIPNMIIIDRNNEQNNSEFKLPKSFTSDRTRQLLLSIGKQLKSWKFQDEQEVDLSKSKSNQSIKSN